MSRFAGETSLTTRSPIRIVPVVGVSSPATIRRAVVLPHPDGPDQHQQLAVGDRQVEVVDGHGAALELLGHGVEPHLAHDYPLTPVAAIDRTNNAGRR